jgi:hypothetical protein
LKDALYEEEAVDETTEVDESADNEEEAQDAVAKGGRNYKKLSASDENFADIVALILKYDMEFGSPTPVCTYVTPNNVRLGDWLHEQCKKYKDDRLSESRVRTLSGLGVKFEKQRTVVGKRYTVATAIFAIHKYEKEHGHFKVKKMEDPHLYCWIIHAKAVSTTIIEQGHGNKEFTLPHLISLHKLGLIVLPHKFKLQPKTKGTDSGNVLVKKKIPIKLKVTKLVAPTKTRKTTQKAPTKMTPPATRSSPRKKKQLTRFPLSLCPPPLPLAMSIISTTTPNVPDGSPVLNTANDSTVLPTITTSYVSLPNVVVLPDIKLPNVVHPAGATQSGTVATRQFGEEVDMVSRRQHFSRASSPTPSLEDYKIGPVDLTVFPPAPSKVHVPVFLNQLQPD